MVQTDSTRKPTVYFPTDGAKPELRLFRVDPNHLELVENPPPTEISPSLIEDENHAEPSHDTADVEAATSDGGGTLSQSEMDNLFA